MQLINLLTGNIHVYWERTYLNSPTCEKRRRMKEHREDIWRSGTIQETIWCLGFKFWQRWEGSNSGWQYIHSLINTISEEEVCALVLVWGLKPRSFEQDRVKKIGKPELPLNILKTGIRSPTGSMPPWWKDLVDADGLQTITLVDPVLILL